MMIVNPSSGQPKRTFIESQPQSQSSGDSQPGGDAAPSHRPQAAMPLSMRFQNPPVMISLPPQGMVLPAQFSPSQPLPTGHILGPISPMLAPISPLTPAQYLGLYSPSSDGFSYPSGPIMLSPVEAVPIASPAPGEVHFGHHLMVPIPQHSMPPPQPQIPQSQSHNNLSHEHPQQQQQPQNLHHAQSFPQSQQQQHQQEQNQQEQGQQQAQHHQQPVFHPTQPQILPLHSAQRLLPYAALLNPQQQHVLATSLAAYPVPHFPVDANNSSHNGNHKGMSLEVQTALMQARTTLARLTARGNIRRTFSAREEEEYFRKSRFKDVALFVFHLPQYVTENDLKEMFSITGDVTTVCVMRDSVSRISKGYGFVNLKTFADAERSIQVWHGARLGDKFLKVTFKQKTLNELSCVTNPQPAGFGNNSSSNNNMPLVVAAAANSNFANLTINTMNVNNHFQPSSSPSSANAVASAPRSRASSAVVSGPSSRSTSIVSSNSDIVAALSALQLEQQRERDQQQLKQQQLQELQQQQQQQQQEQQPLQQPQPMQ